MKELQAPIGEKGAFLTTHYFDYAFNYPNGKFNNGSTYVYDAYGRPTIYHYDQDERLNQVVHYNGPDVHHIDAYFFEGKGSSQEGNLIAHYLRDPCHNTIKGKVYCYDSKGNVAGATVFSSVTGKNDTPITLRSDSRPNDGAECYGSTFEYCGRDNLLSKEREDNGKGIWYTYCPDSNGVASRLLVNGSDQILAREFNSYNHDLFLYRKIVDDGNAWDKEDLSGVTYRKITRFYPRSTAPFGLINEAIEWYLHPDGHLVLLGSYKNEYSIEGWLTKQDHLDSNQNPRYSLFWEYDAHGNITKEVNAAGEKIIRSYDANDNLISEKIPSQQIERIIAYDYVNRPITIEEKHKDGTQFIEKNTYDLVGNLISKKDPRGNVTNYEYDGQNRLISIIYPQVMYQGKLTRPKEVFAYDILGSKTLHQDKDGFQTKTKCNAKGSPLHITYADGSTERFEYYPNGDLEKAIHKNGSYTLYTRDCLGRATAEEVFAPEGTLLSQKSYVYKGINLISETDPEGIVTTYTYDGAARLIGKQTGDQKTTFTYDPLGRIEKQIDWITETTARVTSFTYDLKNQVLSEIISDLEGNKGLVTQFSYNSFGQVTRIKKGNTVEQFYYNSRQELDWKTDAEGHCTKYEYDYKYPILQGWIGKKITITDPAGNTTIEIQDPLGRVIETKANNKSQKLLSQTKYHYSLEGDLIKVEERRVTKGSIVDTFVREYSYNAVHKIISLKEGNEVKTCHYNGYGELSSIVKPDGVALYYTYDTKGRLSELNSSTVSYRYTYNRNDQITQVEDLIHHQTTYRAYDSNGKLVEETLGNGFTIGYNYDPLGRKTKLFLPAQLTIDYLYDPCFLREIKQGSMSYRRDAYDLLGNILKSTLPENAGTLTHSYDLLQRRLSVVHANFKHTIPKKGYDKVGNLLTDTLQDDFGTLERNFSYDDLNQLTSEDGMEAHTYAYDSLNNRIQKNSTPCTINPLNHLISQEETIYTYDQNGNRIQKEEDGRVTTYAYDALNRMIQVITPDQTVNYTYDSFDRRLLKTTGDITESYLYDGQNEIGMLQNGLWKQFRILDQTSASEQGAAVVFELSNETFVPLHDIQGNVAALLNPDGTSAKTYRYTAFGLEVAFSSSDINPWRYASKRYDPETGFIYFGRRYYDPKVARWTSPDPSEYEDGSNLFIYLRNNPLNRRDPYGLWGEDEYWESELGFGDEFNRDPFDLCRSQSGFLQGCASSISDMGLGLSFGIGYTFYSSAAWMGADFEYEFGDSSVFNSHLKSLEPGCHAFRQAFNQNLYSTLGDVFVPGIMEYSRLSNSSTPFERGVAGGKAFVDVSMIAQLARGAFKFWGGVGKEALFSLRGAGASLTSKGTLAAESSIKEVSVGRQIWSSTNKRSSVQNALYHWKKHGKEFSHIQNAKEYVENAWSFLKNPPHGTLFKTRPNGEFLLYHPETNVFGSYTKNRIPKTVFHPEDFIKYWERQ